MDFGLVLTSYYGCWEDAAFAEAHGFATAGFIDSPLLAADPFVCAALAAERTSEIRLGTLLAIPGNRNAASLVSASASLNRLAPGRVFIGLGTGHTGRALFGRKPVTVKTLQTYYDNCRDLLDGKEVMDGTGDDLRPIRMRQANGVHVDTEHRIPIYIGADGPRALAISGTSDGWVASMKNANIMSNAAEVFADSLGVVGDAARAAHRDLDDIYTMASAAVCILEPGEPATSPRVLERVGAYAMLTFHVYADNPAIAEHLPPAMRDRIDAYEREVLSRLPVSRDRFYQEVNCGHLSHLIDGEAAVLTEEIIKMTTITGTLDEVVDVIRGLEAAGLDNLTLNPPPPLAREIISETAEKIMPMLAASTH